MYRSVLVYIIILILFDVCSSYPLEKNYFTCESQCDDMDDCSVGSDEKRSVCIEYPRREQNFYCSYGPQLDNDLVCNDTPDCLDGSDEYFYFCEYHRANEDQKNLLNEKLHGSCSTEEFDCRSNKCIDWGETCDGRMDCPNGLDETPEICLRNINPCNIYQFKCAYGACINTDLLCNGVNDCVDGSDEAISRNNCTLKELIKGPTMTNLFVPKYKNYCHVPLGHEVKITSGHKDNIELFHNITYVKWSTAVKFECNDGYNVSNIDLTKRVFVCGKDDKWSNTIPKCIRKCKALTSSETVNITCPNEDCLSLLVGAEAHLICAYGYSLTNKTKPIVTCQENGEWTDGFDTDMAKTVCVQKCGIVKEPRGPLAIKGNEIGTYKMPWHIAIYSLEDPSKSKYICSGNILSAVWVLTAAHCIVDDYNEPKIETTVVLIANKQYREIDDRNTETNSEHQMRSVIGVYPNENYTGLMESYVYDVGLLKVKEPFKFNERVFPICGPTEEMLKQPQLLNEEVAHLCAYDAHYKYISVLGGKVTKSSMNTHSKFIVDNNSRSKKGDSGGGVFIDKNGKKYIRGIISNGLGSSQSVVTMSDMYNIEVVNWIRSYVLEFQIDSSA